jgi:hypothetical protein
LREPFCPVSAHDGVECNDENFMKLKLNLNVLLLLLLSLPAMGRAQGTAFSYQGHLVENGVAANGGHDFNFILFDAAAGGGQIGPVVSLNNTPVASGQFNVALDFGANAFPGDPRWLEISVRPAGVGQFTTMDARVALLPTPYAIFAATAGSVANGALTANQLNTGGVAPTAGQFLSYSGGNLFWSDPGVAAGNIWSLNGADAYYNAGNVGIGTSTPTVGIRLEVNGNARITPGGSGGYLQVGTPNGETGLGVIGNNRFDLRFNGSTLKLVAGLGGGPPPLENGITIDTSGEVGIGRDINFGSQTRQMLNMFGNGFGIGVQTADLYYRSGAGFAWHVGGVHDDATYKAGAGGTTLMTLDVQGLKFGDNRLGQHLWLWSDPATTRYFGIGIQNSTLYNRCGGGGADGFVWYKGGIHSDNYHDGGGGQMLMSLDSNGMFVSSSASVCSLTIRGGCDLAEPFPMKEPEIEKGSVVVIDEDHPGQLKLSHRAYDTRVAGIVSGANGVKPGISLHQDGVMDSGENVALSGRVYVLADAASGPIKPGDLLTTSDTPGCAMKVTDHGKAQGAILGKAMGSLNEGKGMVLVLVSLQ